MKKIEMVWRELLYWSIEKCERVFVQKDLAAKFNFSTSTIFQALKPTRAMGAARVTGRNFTLEDPEKLLYYWASVRNLANDTIFEGRVDLPLLEIEGMMPALSIFAGYSTARFILKEAPADYDKVFVYAKSKEDLASRFDFVEGKPNLYILKSDPFISSYGGKTTLAQTFVDIWNLNDWYAKEFTQALKDRIDDLLH